MPRRSAPGVTVRCGDRGWQQLWGPQPLPINTEAVGVVRRHKGGSGALLLFRATGIYAQGNAGCLTSLPQHDIKLAIARHADRK